ncbi:alpha/beta hydrolase family protein [Sphingomonas sp. PAMC 26617]|uniref:alpha/beta hydrolase family protein n=1 Tax=Sphingomonas sp. PAMC 26617 TaxID=1112216 RepID=UPI0002ED3886|nr:alpha/beta fold hydrolase [Sphingomonas sp. PAMC 26617]
MRKRFIVMVLLATAATPVHAASDAAKKFGAREEVQQISLSPDGKHFVALVSDAKRGVRAMVFPTDSDTPPVVVVASSGEKEQLDYCQWSNNTQLICGLSITVGRVSGMLGFDRIVTLSADGKDMKLLSARTSLDSVGIMQDGGHVIDWQGDAKGDTVLMTRQYVAKSDTGTHIAGEGEGMGVERIDPVTLHRQTVERPRPIAREYIADGQGHVRIMGLRPTTGAGYSGARMIYQYRKPGATAWLPLSTVASDSQTEQGFDPYAVDPALNVTYGFDAQNGRKALYKIALDGSLKRDLVFARPDVDVAGLVVIGRQHRVVGATYVTDRRQVEFFDPELKKLQTSLAKALPKQPLVRFVDASADESKLLLWTGSDVDPGGFALFDKKTRHLGGLLRSRPPLEGVTLAPVKAITFPAADGTPIPAYLTLPVGQTPENLPAIVMPHGGPGARDEWGFDWLAQFFAARGYAVLQPNYRGSTGYGDGWFQKNGFQSWRTVIGDVNDGGHWLVKEGIAAPSTLAIVGWSYGGYAALQSAVLDPALFKAIVAIAPVTDLDTLRHEHDNYMDYNLVDAFIGKGPHVRQGSHAQNAAKITAPVLMFHGDLDQNVGIGESRLMASRLRNAGKKVELVEFKGLTHQLDDSEARTTMLDRSDTFLRATMGIQ